MSWEQIATEKLSSPADNWTEFDSFTATNLQYWILSVINTGGGLFLNLTWNNETGSEYSTRRSFNGGSEAGYTNLNYIEDFWSSGSFPVFSVSHQINVAGEQKMIIANTVSRGTAGSGNAPDRAETGGKFALTSGQVTASDWLNVGSGDYDDGSQLTVLGVD